MRILPDIPEVVIKCTKLKKIHFISSLVALVFLLFCNKIYAQEALTNLCTNVKKGEILYGAMLLFYPDLQEKLFDLGIEKSNLDISSYKTDDPNFIDNITEYLGTHSISLVQEENICSYINRILTKENIRNTLPGRLREIYYQIDNKFMVIFRYDCGKGCVRLGGDKLPVYIIDKDEQIHELTKI